MTSYGVDEHMFDESMHHCSFTEPFLKETNLNDNDPPDSSSYSSPFTLSPTSSLSSDISQSSLESSDDDSVKNENEEPNYYCTGRGCGRSTRNSNRRFPPPIPCIGASGKPLVSLQKIRHDGRFILVQVMIPCQEFIHARRENGCLKMHFIRSESESENPASKPWKIDGNVER